MKRLFLILTFVNIFFLVIDMYYLFNGINPLFSLISSLINLIGAASSYYVYETEEQ